MKRSDRRTRAAGSVRPVVVSAILLGTVLMVAAAFALTRPDAANSLDSNTTRVSALESYESSAPVVLASSEQSASIEVPVLTGKTVTEATVIAKAVGLLLEIRHDRSTSDDGSGGITMQEPVAGELVSEGSSVMVRVPAPAGSKAELSQTGIVVCIDPGHQSSSDLAQEPIGPGASEMKPRVTGGTTGIGTKIPEFELALQISINLKQRLEARGIQVVMTRVTNDVTLSNAERAQIANDAGASLFVRVHADGSTDSSVAGISTLFPAQNKWTGPIAGESKRAAGLIQDATVSSTGASSRGTVARGDIAGFNWSEVPAVLVECGFMSNTVEDKLLASPHYQDSLTQGMANGILAYLGSQ